MRRRFFRIVVISLIFVSLGEFTLVVGQSPSTENPVSIPTLEAEIARIARRVSGSVGVAAIHVESGRLVMSNGQVRFPMASTYKVPIAVQLLTRVDRGEIALDKMVSLRPTDFRPGSEMSLMFDDPGVTLSLRNLLDLSLSISDNTAADRILEIAGGPAAVNSRLRELGIEGMQIDRSTLHFGAFQEGPTCAHEK